MMFSDKLTCPSCQNVNTVEAEIEDLDSVDTTERGMGPEVEYEGSIQHVCSNCNSNLEILVGVWEYPVGSINLIQVNSITKV